MHPEGECWKCHPASPPPPPGRVLFGLNGDWGEPMGAAFEGLDTSAGLFPAFSGREGVHVSVNFGHLQTEYGPPDASFRLLKDVVGK